MITIIRTTNKNFVDIHSHLIYGVDDGAKTKGESIKYLKQAKKYGVKKIICTPHICYGKLERIDKIKSHFLELRDYAEKLGISMYLGTEILMTESTCELLKRKRLRSLDGNKFVLVEFKRNENMDFDSLIYMLEELMDIGYIPVLAHPESYINYRNISYMKTLKENGVLLQLDATSILKNTATKEVYKFSKKLLKAKLIDLVASDTHCNSKRSYKSYYKAYKFICRKYGKKYANRVFVTNPKQILYNED